MEEKSNVSRVKKILGSYQFRIEGYSGLSSRVGDCVESPEFVLCGHKWQLRIFPGGSLENHKDFASFYLASKSNKLARASYKLIVVNQVIGGEDEVFCSSGIRIFEAKGVQVSLRSTYNTFHCLNIVYFIQKNMCCIFSFVINLID
jgi:hypothetical protein